MMRSHVPVGRCCRWAGPPGLVVVLAGLLPAPGAAADPDEDLRAAVVSAWKEQQARAGFFRVKWKETRLVPKGGLTAIGVLRPQDPESRPADRPIPPEDFKETRESSLAVAGDRYRYTSQFSGWSRPEQRWTAHSYTYSYDGRHEYQIILRPGGTDPPEFTRNEVAKRESRLLGIEHAPIALALRGADPADRIGPELAEFRVSGRGALVNGEQCVEFHYRHPRFKSEITLSLSPRMGYMPVRLVRTYGGNPEHSNRTDIRYALHADRRIWLPTEWDCVVSHVEKSSRQARDVAFTFEVQPTDREFRLEAPPGANICEMKNGVPVPR